MSYLERLAINNDQIFGFQVNSGWDLYQLLGFLKKPQQTRWIGVLDYLSERGVGYGSEFYYRRDGLFGIPGVAQGEYRSWFINDQGLDTLGRDRMNLVPEQTNRGRIVGWHRQQFAPGFNLKAELGYISDRDFLEQFYEREWDTGRDALTGFQLERKLGTRSYALAANIQINDFFRANQLVAQAWISFVLGQSVLNESSRLVWAFPRWLRQIASRRSANESYRVGEILSAGVGSRRTRVSGRHATGNRFPSASWPRQSRAVPVG